MLAGSSFPFIEPGKVEKLRESRTGAMSRLIKAITDMMQSSQGSPRKGRKSETFSRSEFKKLIQQEFVPELQVQSHPPALGARHGAHQQGEGQVLRLLRDLRCSWHVEGAGSLDGSAAGISFQAFPAPPSGPGTSWDK
ncbi:hypothetical protein DV515_00016271 [Chloebia gouldiae]|uniref:Uncharacterized protein n=1 Tax=Chloebia gouldiae TaxID=44316 RepID=A0A3L8RSS4_CHLGU|nr:hypothetical protein DV515_00016271 [Chloebia gouldiae]